MNNNTYPEYPEGGKRVSGGQRSADQPNGGRRRRRKRKQSRALYYVILVILLGVLVFSAVKIISYFRQQAAAADAQQGVLDDFITPLAIPTTTMDRTIPATERRSLIRLPLMLTSISCWRSTPTP